MDPSTALGADLARWAYPASIPTLITIAAQIGDPKQSRKVMPWAMEHPRRKAQASSVTAAEIAIAEAELEADFVFT